MVHHVSQFAVVCFLSGSPTGSTKYLGTVVPGTPGTGLVTCLTFVKTRSAWYDTRYLVVSQYCTVE